MNTGGPAFYVPDYVSQDGQRDNGSGSDGMTLRDYFAAKALPSIISRLPKANVASSVPESEANRLIAEIKANYCVAAAAGAYAYADAMLVEREKTK